MESIVDLTLEERHVIVRQWLNDLTTVYEKAAAERDTLRAAVSEAHRLLMATYTEDGATELHEQLLPLLAAALARGDGTEARG